MKKKRFFRWIAVCLSCTCILVLLAACTGLSENRLDYWAEVPAEGNSDAGGYTGVATEMAFSEGVPEIATVDASEGTAYSETVVEDNPGFLDFIINNPIVDFLFPDAGYDDFMTSYKGYGITYDKATGLYWYDQRPVGAMYDAHEHMMLQGDYFRKGVLLSVERDADGEIAGVSEVTQKTMAGLLGMTEPEERTVEDEARKEGLAYYREPISVYGMSADELSQLECDLYIKYPEQDATVELNDYIVPLSSKARLGLTSFLSATGCDYGVKVYADFAIANTMDIQMLDIDKTEEAAFVAMNKQAYKNADDLAQAVAQQIASAYHIPQENIYVEADALL
ncbi:MAG: hypothetical protein ACOYJB_06905 [Christensenellaceae bacterium]